MQSAADGDNVGIIFYSDEDYGDYDEGSRDDDEINNESEESVLLYLTEKNVQCNEKAGVTGSWRK